MFRATAEPEARKLLGAESADHRLSSVVTACAPVRMNPDRAPRQLHLVPQHQQIAQLQLVLAQQLPHRNAAEIHVRLRLRQNDSFSGDLPAPDQCLALWTLHADRSAIGQLIHRKKAQVMRRPLIFRVGIAKADNEPHTLFSAGLGLASASAPSSPSTSFLPFLMTSGSAGTAASVAATSAGFSSSTRSATTWARTRSGSVISFSLAVSSANSPARSCLPSIKWLTSTL